MKAPLAAGLASLLLGATCFAQSEIPQLMTEGQRAYNSGDLAKAKEDFQMVVALDPTNTTAATYLRMIRVRQPPNAPVDADAPYAAVRIPKIDLRDATLGSALEYLKQTLAKTTDGKTQINLVVQVPADVLQNRVTLKLENTPFTEVLRYVGDLAGVTFTYEKYAVVVKTKGG